MITLLYLQIKEESIDINPVLKTQMIANHL